MLEFVNVKNFKTLLNASFPLGKLNLFSGLNGMGKSTLMQVLLLLRQSHEQNTLKDRGLLLNGSYVNIGIGRDAFSVSCYQDEMEFVLKWSKEEGACTFRFDYKLDSELLLLCQNHKKIKLNFDAISLFNSRFQYLSAERLGPKSHHQLSDFHVRDKRTLGKHGEYAVHFIAENGNNKVNIQGLMHPKARSGNLLANLDAWMSEITPGVRVQATPQPQYNSVSLSYSFKQGKELTADFKPQNVGFGLSYVLPVVTCILSASKGDLLIIENPESHLHPAGQAAVGRLCAIAASNGVQLVIESHSDHFLNGLRVAVKKELIHPDAVKIFFLFRDIETEIHSSEIIYPKIDDQGRIDSWPDGFFDEWDKRLDDLL